MAFIKSAFELAMEKTQGLTIDKEEFHKKEMFNLGRMATAEALGTESSELEKTIAEQEKKLSKPDFKLWSQGAAETLLARITLNAELGPTSELNKVFQLLDTLARQKAGQKLQAMAGQLSNYQQELVQLKEAIAQKIGPAIRQRAQQLAQQTGASPQFILEKDPTYLKYLSENLEPMKAEYNQNLTQLKDEYRKDL